MTDRRTPNAAAELRHELRTPVNHIIGYAEMLLEDVTEADPPAYRDGLKGIVAAGREVLTLIAQLLGAPDAATDPASLDRLHQAVRPAQRRIIDVVRELLATRPAGGDPRATEDLETILHAAEQLAPLAAEPGSSEAAPKMDAPAAPERGAPAAAERPARVLVVDDVKESRDMLRRHLERSGYEAISAENGREALEMIGRGDYDLVLLDMLMPEMDGYEVLSRLKDAPATRDIPVIMVSALDDMENIVRCIERGAEDFLPKPFDSVLLRARTSASLEKKRLRDLELQYMRQVGRVIEAATAVEQGTYEAGSLGAIASRSDELGRLARVFDGMAVEVHLREERLTKQLRQLRGDIKIARTSREWAVQLDGASLEAGLRFGDRYEVIGLIGRGGMGAVYHARDLELGEEVAIKTLRPELVTDETLVERFKQEIRLARKVSHRNVVRTHDLGEWRGVYYLTMEYVEGMTVRDLIDLRGALQAPSALAIATQLVESLVVAHQQGIIHRDIKPQNLLLDAEGVLKVMDFGIARLAEGTSNLTEAGLIVGTPAYMSPEQLLGEQVDVRTDLYAVGVVLYECLTGRLPFEAPSTVALIAKVMTDEPTPPADLKPDIPPALGTLVLRLLAKKSDARVQTADELAGLLRVAT